MPNAIGTVGGRGRPCGWRARPALRGDGREQRGAFSADARALRIALVPLLAGKPRWEERMLLATPPIVSKRRL